MKEKRRGNYGFIEFVDLSKTDYPAYPPSDAIEFRKPTPEEREEIILNYIRKHSGKSIRVWLLAKKLAVSDRTIQKILKKFKEQGLISITPNFDKYGQQRANVLTYLGEDKKVPKNGLTLNYLYKVKNPCGFRHWRWEEFKFAPGFFDEYFTKEISEYGYNVLKLLRKTNAAKRKKFRERK